VKTDVWLSRLLGLWLVSFAGLLAFLYVLFIGADVDGRSMFQYLLR
jgi:hypothetical protein